MINHNVGSTSPSVSEVPYWAAPPISQPSESLTAVFLYQKYPVADLCWYWYYYFQHLVTGDYAYQLGPLTTYSIPTLHLCQHDNDPVCSINMMVLRFKYEKLFTWMQISLDSYLFHAWLGYRAKYYHLSNSLSRMLDKQHPYIISKQADDKLISEQWAQLYFLVPN